ncbi:MAG: helix-turn-helix domain-containing protein [Bacteroidales bacterium]|nr:helix-turn-helix domain-containing protein [Bacteroidales bacterium]
MKKANIDSYPISEEHQQELKKIGQVIRELRINYGLLTQKELATMSGVHFNTIRAIEHGEKNYNILTLMNILSFFNYELTTFSQDFL